MEGPCGGCTQRGQYEVLQKLDASSDFCRCQVCGRTYVLAELHLDAMCIETIEQKIWKEMETPPRSEDPVDYLMKSRPYFASSRGGAFHKVEERSAGPADRARYH